MSGVRPDIPSHDIDGLPALRCIQGSTVNLLLIARPSNFSSLTNAESHMAATFALVQCPRESSAIQLPQTSKLHSINKFELFPELPLELRWKIWVTTMIPRLVHWRPGGGKAPAIAAVSKEAREAVFTKYVICFETYHQNRNYAIFIAPGFDTIYCKNKLPNMTRIRNVGLLPINIIVQKGAVGREWNLRPWTPSIKSLIIDLDDAIASDRDIQGQTLWVKLKHMFPELEELGIALFPKIRKHHRLNDLVEAKFDEVNLQQQSMIAQFNDSRQIQLTEGKYLGLEIKFLQLSPLASSAPDKPLLVPDRPRRFVQHQFGPHLKPRRRIRK